MVKNSRRTYNRPNSESTGDHRGSAERCTAGETRKRPSPAVGFLVVAFVDENAADEALDEMKRAKKQNEFYFEDAAVIRQDANGKVHYHETGDMSTGGARVRRYRRRRSRHSGRAGRHSAGRRRRRGCWRGACHRDSGFRDESLNTIGVAQARHVGCCRHHQPRIPAGGPAASQHRSIRTVIRNLSQQISDRLAENMNMAIGLDPDRGWPWYQGSRCKQRQGRGNRCSYHR